MTTDADFKTLDELGHRRELAPDEMQRRADAFFEEIAQRHSIRDFSDKPVALETIQQCVRAAGRAPSGANHQPWHFAIVGDAGVKRRIREAAEAEEREFYAGRAGDEWLDALKPIGTDANKPFLETAPWLIVIFAQNKGGVTVEDQRKNYYVRESVGIATGFLIAALHSAGLSTLTHTPAPMGFVREILGRPTSEKPYLILVVGHPTDEATVPDHALQKKKLDEISSIF